MLVTLIHKLNLAFSGNSVCLIFEILLFFLMRLYLISILQAVYHAYYGNSFKALEHYLGCEFWQKAHSTFITSVAHSLFMSGRL